MNTFLSSSSAFLSRFVAAVALWVFFAPFAPEVWAQTASPTMTCTNPDEETTEETAYDGSAPMTATFAANPEDVGLYTPLYEWRFYRGTETTPFLTRYDENTTYTFASSGSYTIELFISFVLGSDTIEYEMDEAFTVTIAESKLEIPNAFTPNDDGVNDTFHVKDTYQSIVSFNAKVFSRWGKLIYEWDKLDGAWDGTSGGKKCPEGAYYLVVKARGADGKSYNVKKTISLVRGYREDTSGAATE